MLIALRRWLCVSLAVASTAVAARSAAGEAVESIASPAPASTATVSANSFLDEALPGAPPMEETTRAKLAARWQARDAGYKPRTRHLNADGSPRYTNRLFLESSPYLQQHAHNPVNWYPWGDEAFETAKKLGRPVFLSVGYSTCHWCHVMEEESFEDEEIARTLNENYIPIKVDREDRPDVDAIYMRAVLAMTGGGGWPMNVWLTPERKPFFGGTYFPARDGDRGKGTGFLTLLKRLKTAYDTEPGRVAESAGKLVHAIQAEEASSATAAALPDAKTLDAALDFYRSRYDRTNGGLGGAPKFPSSLPIRFLLRYQRRVADKTVLAMATHTLEQMAAGGMADQVGGGFHRYSTDARWLVPHFEKMLYDNALLAVAYLEAYQATGRRDFADVARRILRYLERDMTSPEGAFYTATDADSLTPGGRREEGWYFTWTPAEIREALGEERARAATLFYGVSEAGNFEKRNILHVAKPIDALGSDLHLSPEQARRMVDEVNDRLYSERAKRPPPLRDEKILASSNALAISAFARAALVLGDPSYATKAARAADVLLTQMRRDGRLLHSSRSGHTGTVGFLDDYAFAIAALLDLFEATGEPRWLREALALDEVLARHFEDQQSGGFYLTADDHEALLARAKPSYDGAEPSGNSVEALNLLRLAELTGNEAYRTRAERTLRAFAPALEQNVSALSEMLLAVEFRSDLVKEIVIVTPTARADAEPFLAKLRASFVPNRVLVVAVEGSDLSAQAKLVPLVEGKVARGGKATAYVCEKGVCGLPTTDPAVFAEQLSKSKPLSP